MSGLNDHFPPDALVEKPRRFDSSHEFLLVVKSAAQLTGQTGLQNNSAAIWALIDSISTIYFSSTHQL